MHLNHVARGPGVGRHDRRLALGQPIEQRRLAGVWGSCDRHHQAFAQSFAAATVGQRRGNFRLQFARNYQRRRQQIVRHIGLVGKIDAGLDQRQRLDQPLPPGFRAAAEQAFHLAERLPALPLRLRHHQVGETFHRGEIELAVLEGAAGELARFRHPQAFDGCERRQHRGDHRAAAVQLQLGHVLAGLAMRRRKP